MSKSALNTPCWDWPGRLWDSGYGVVQKNSKSLRAHRVVYEAAKGKIPDGKVLDHLCRNRRCVNPDHLEPVTLSENILRGESPTAINARKTHCDNGHEFTDENTRVYRGYRICKICARETTRRRMQEKRARDRAALKAAMEAGRDV